MSDEMKGKLLLEQARIMNELSGEMINKESKLPWSPGQPMPERPKVPGGELDGDQWKALSEAVSTYMDCKVKEFKESHGSSATPEVLEAMHRLQSAVWMVGGTWMPDDERRQILTDGLDSADALVLIEVKPAPVLPVGAGDRAGNSGVTLDTIRFHPSQVRSPRQA